MIGLCHVCWASNVAVDLVDGQPKCTACQVGAEL